MIDNKVMSVMDPDESWYNFANLAVMKIVVFVDRIYF